MEEKNSTAISCESIYFNPEAISEQPNPSSQDNPQQYRNNLRLECRSESLKFIYPTMTTREVKSSIS